MKNIHKTLLKSGVLIIMLLGLFSCEDYLDKAPESIISEEVAFSNFTNF